MKGESEAIPTMRENKFLHCICCGGFTLHRFKKWWIHRKCEEEVKYRIMLAKHEIPNIEKEILFGSPKLLESAIVNLGNSKVVASIRRDIKKKAWQILEQRYGKASWLRNE